MRTFTLAATHPAYLHVGEDCELRSIVSVRAAGTGAGGVYASLELWTPRGARAALFGERMPATRDLLAGAVRLDDQTIARAAGRWADGPREYEIGIVLPPARAGDEMLAAQLSVVVGGEVVGRAQIAVTWTDDEALAATQRRRGDQAVASSVVAELPTGPSPEPRHTFGSGADALPCCPACDLRAADGDRFCERCGQALGAAQKS